MNITKSQRWYQNIFLLINSPIAVAESILGINTNYQFGAEMISERKLDRNIQYSQYLTPDFYNHIILHTLKHKTNTYEFLKILYENRKPIKRCNPFTLGNW